MNLEELSKYLINMVVEWQVSEFMITPNESRDTKEELQKIINQYKEQNNEQADAEK